MVKETIYKGISKGKESTQYDSLQTLPNLYNKGLPDYTKRE